MNVDASQSQRAGSRQPNVKACVSDCSPETFAKHKSLLRVLQLVTAREHTDTLLELRACVVLRESFILIKAQ